MSAIAFRLPYDPAFAGRNHRRHQREVSASVGLRRARARVGDAAATALTPPDTSTRDLAVYVGAPSLGGALIGGLIAGLPGAIIVMILAGGGGYFLLQNQKASVANDLCSKDLPEPNRSIALAVLAGTDVAKLTSISTQSDARGWHCAATEMRARIKALTPIEKTGAPGPTAEEAAAAAKKKLGGTEDYPTTTTSGSPDVKVVPADKDKTLEQLPDAFAPWAPYGIRAYARDVITNEAKWPHDKTGWLGTGTNGPAFLWGKLREAGYMKAADEVIWTYLHTFADPDKPGGGWFSGAGSGSI